MKEEKTAEKKMMSFHFLFGSYHLPRKIMRELFSEQTILPLIFFLSEDKCKERKRERKNEREREDEEEQQKRERGNG